MNAPIVQISEGFSKQTSYVILRLALGSWSVS